METITIFCAALCAVCTAATLTMFCKWRKATKADVWASKMLGDLRQMMDDLKANMPKDIDPSFFKPTLND